MNEAKEEAARYRRETRLAYGILAELTTDIADEKSILTQLNAQLDSERKRDFTGIMKGVAAIQDLDAIRKDHLELFDKKGRYRKNAGKNDRGDRVKDLIK